MPPTSDGTGRALPFPDGSRLPASPFQTRSGDPPSAPRPLARLALRCWLQKATFQRPPPPTPCQPQILGRAGLGGVQVAVREDCGRGRSQNTCPQEVRGTRPETGKSPPPETGQTPQQKHGGPPAPGHFPGTVHLWPAYHPEGSISDTAFLKRHILFTWQSSSSYLL